MNAYYVPDVILGAPHDSFYLVKEGIVIPCSTEYQWSYC